MITFWHCIIQKLNKGKNNPVQTSAQFKAQKEFSYILSNSNFRVFSVKMMSSWRGSSDSNPHRNLTSTRTLLRCLKKVEMRLLIVKANPYFSNIYCFISELYLIFQRNLGHHPRAGWRIRGCLTNHRQSNHLPGKGRKNPQVWHHLTLLELILTHPREVSSEKREESVTPSC